DYNKGGLINTRYLYFASMGFWLILARSLEQLYQGPGKGKRMFVSTYMIITVLLSSAVLYGNNYAYQYAAGIAKEITLQTKNKFPLFAGSNTKFYFINILCPKSN
ncbi:MAG: hypothetical protein NT033_03650, partial [Candidatus Omnitrophica bacterium]|nr:hypothetical protein [Candidatus Omnitrophota bacterium]